MGKHFDREGFVVRKVNFTCNELNNLKFILKKGFKKTQLNMKMS